MVEAAGEPVGIRRTEHAGEPKGSSDGPVVDTPAFVAVAEHTKDNRLGIEGAGEQSRIALMPSEEVVGAEGKAR